MTRLMLSLIDRIIELLFIGQDLAATLCEAKPPNTTEWIAPMRAQASSVMCASAIIGI